MSAVDRIRELLAKRSSRSPWWVNDGATIAILGDGDDGERYEVGSPHVTGDARADAELIALLGSHAEALCDLADAWREDRAAAHAMDSLAEDIAIAKGDAALARLDGEEQT